MDELTILRAQKGDKESFANAIYEIHEQAYIMAFSYLHSEQESIDAVANAVEKCFRHISKLKDARYFKTWFLKSVINECKMFLRKDRPILNNDIYSTNNEFSNVETMIDFKNLLRKELPENRTMIYMKYYLGYTLDEISCCFNLPINTVKTKIYTSIKRIKSEMER